MVVEPPNSQSASPSLPGRSIGLWKYAVTVASSPATTLSTWPSVCMRAGKAGSISASHACTSWYDAAMPPVAV